MTFLRLFQNKMRSDPQPMKAHESMMQFLDRVGPTPRWEEVRSLLDDWLQRHPSPQDIGHRFGKEFNAMFWELYIHELFSRLGYKAELERAGTENRPDFVFSNSIEQLVVECWCSESAGFDRTLEPDARSRKLQVVPYDDQPARWLASVLNDKIESTALGVWIDEVEAKPNPPKSKSVVRPVQSWLDSRPPLHESREFLVPDLAGANREAHSGDDDGWRFVLTAVERLAGERIVVGWPSINVDTDRASEALATGLVAKAKKNYLQDHDEILVVAANWPSTFLKESEVEAALYGEGGLWSRGRYRRVDAVLLATYIKPWSVAESLPVLWLGPSPHSELQLPFETVRKTGPMLIKQEATVKARELFQLADEWGITPPFPTSK